MTCHPHTLTAFTCLTGQSNAKCARSSRKGPQVFRVTSSFWSTESTHTHTRLKTSSQVSSRNILSKSPLKTSFQKVLSKVSTLTSITTLCRIFSHGHEYVFHKRGGRSSGRANVPKNNQTQYNNHDTANMAKSPFVHADDQFKQTEEPTRMMKRARRGSRCSRDRRYFACCADSIHS